MSTAFAAGLPGNVDAAGSEMRAVCSIDTCRHSWVVAYLPMDMAKLAKLLSGVACPMCGDDNPNVAPSMPLVSIPQTGAPDAALAWARGNDRGLSSQAIWDHMVTGQCDGNYPLDPEDLGRCLRLLGLVPEWKPRMVEMRVYNNTWALYCIYWDELVDLMTDECGLGIGGVWKSKYAPKTYERMRELRDLADA